MSVADSVPKGRPLIGVIGAGRASAEAVRQALAALAH